MNEPPEIACSPERVAIVFNPASGMEDGVSRRARLEALAEAAGLSGELRETDPSAGAAPLARQAVREGVERLLVSGGDGSVTEAAGELVGTRTALGVLPGGTGNLLALNLGIPVDPEAALHLALTGTPRPVDVGRANGRAFLIMAGMGADARMIRTASRSLKKRLGVLAYFVAAWRNRGRRTRYALKIDDGRWIRRTAQTVLLANVGRITAGIELIPGADPENGVLEVAIFRARTLWDILLIAVRALLGQVRSNNLLEIHQARRVSIRTRRPQAVQIDGNAIGSTRQLDAWIEPGKLLVVRPEPGAEAKPVFPLPRVPGTPSVWPFRLPPSAVPPWIPLAAGIGAGAACALRARAARKQDREPGPLACRPVLGGAMAAAAALLAALVVPKLCGGRARQSKRESTGP